MSIKQIFEKYLENFFGILIALNIIHQIIDSTNIMDTYPQWQTAFDLFFPISMVIFVGETALRTYLDRRLGFLGWMDVVVVVNFFLGGAYDLRAFRLFRVFEIY